MATESQLRDTLRVHIRQQIENGLLPVFIPETIHAGYGAGIQCFACHQPITPEQIEYEIEDAEHLKRLRFHIGCHGLWQIECGEWARRNMCAYRPSPD